MFSTDFIFRQQENLVDNQKGQAGFRPLRIKIPFMHCISIKSSVFCFTYKKALDSNVLK